MAVVWRRLAVRWRGARPFMSGLIYLLVLAAPWVAWRVMDWSQEQAYSRLEQQGREHLALYAQALHSEITTFRNVPLVLASDAGVRALLTTGGDAAALSSRLEALNRILGASALYVLDRQGLTLAASNWRDPGGGFVGRRFDFRPYFTAAMAGLVGQYFALGSTSNRPGDYIAVPVRQGGAVVGAVVVKTAMDALERGWSSRGERVFVSDGHGVIFITNTPSWRYLTRAPLPAATLAAIRASRQYGDAPLHPLPVVAGSRLQTVDGVGYVAVSAPLADGDGWRLSVLQDAAAAEAAGRQAGLLALLSMALAGVAAYYLSQRSLRRRRQTRELERRVAERTHALTRTNQRLEAEIAERVRAETELRAKQQELVQAAKLAALGQMSAGMVHELNQPLAALRGFAENARTFLAQNRPRGAEDNLGEIVALTERMARITGQLKQFARKSSDKVAAVDLIMAVEGALSMLSGRLGAAGVAVEWAPPPRPLPVWAEDVRLQQVLVNLLRNALDAMDGGAVPPRLALRLAGDRAHAVLAVEDNGPGIDAALLPHLFEPFFTTKPAGEGLGLGLSISEGIVRAFGGGLTAAAAPGGGAVFTLTLRRVEE